LTSADSISDNRLHADARPRTETRHVFLELALLAVADSLKAEEVLAERSGIRLSPQAAAAFSQALEQPVEVNDRLTRALRRERKFSWLD
jgi:Protein of unknown function (DUF1778)